jgi:hypothetical protein
MSANERHAAEIQRLAESYRQQGYEVRTEPRGGDLPPFLRGLFVPDLLALKEGDNLVVEVAGPNKRPLEHIVERVEKEPGWTFILVVLSDEGDREIPVQDEVEIRRRLASPEQLFASGEKEAALMLAWSLFEAAARRRMALDGSDFGRTSGFEALLKRLIHLGYLPQNAMAELGDLAKRRNRTAHGTLGVPVAATDLARLRQATDSLLTDPQAAE